MRAGAAPHIVGLCARSLPSAASHQHAQILAQHRAAFERQRQPEIAVEMAFMRLVEDDRRYAGQFGIGEDRLILCTITFGYKDPDHPANAFRTDRAPLSEILSFAD